MLGGLEEVGWEEGWGEEGRERRTHEFPRGTVALLFAVFQDPDVEVVGGLWGCGSGVMALPEMGFWGWRGGC